MSLFFAFHSMIFYSLVDWFASYVATQGIPVVKSGALLLVYQVVTVATNLTTTPLIRRSLDQMALGLACGLLLALNRAATQQKSHPIVS